MGTPNQDGGEWEIQPKKLSYETTRKRLETTTKFVQEILLKELLKKRPASTDNPEGKSDFMLVYDVIMDMVKNSDIRTRAMGVKLLTDLLAKTEGMAYHPSIMSRIDIDAMGFTSEQKELFMSQLQLANARLLE